MEVSVRLHAQAALSLGKELMVYLMLNTVLYIKMFCGRNQKCLYIMLTK